MLIQSAVDSNKKLVNRNNESIDADVKRLTKEISLVGIAKSDRRKKVELKEHLTNLLEGSKTLIDLGGTILPFLEPPMQNCGK